MHKQLALSLAVTCLFAISMTFHQPTASAQEDPFGVAGQGRGSGSISSTGNRLFGVSKQQRDLDRQIKEEAINLRQAADEGSRSRAEAKLAELLRRDYDERLKGYEEHLDRLAAELDAMRSKLQKRREAKEEMVRLRIQVLQAEADDLGWPERPRRSTFGVSGFRGQNSQRATSNLATGIGDK